MDTGNTAWMLIASGLVLLMTPGLGLFYGGLTRSKNVLGTIMQSFISIGVVALLWITVGYSLAFGPDWHGLIGNFDWVGLKDVGGAPGGPNGAIYGVGVPHVLFMAFQMMFAIITPALITGAFAERAKFGPFLVFTILWSLFVYVPIAHWVFAYDGWLSAFSTDAARPDRGLNALDFAGGIAIHVSAGTAALASVFVFGRRKGYGSLPMEPHDVPMVVLGTALLWFGWFGFNAGSAGGATSQAAYAFVNTNTSGAAAAVVWTILSWRFNGKPSVLGCTAGAVAGLAAVTPASGFIEPMEAMVIGLVSGALCFFAVRWRARIHLDDSLDVVGVHGVGGIWGSVACGLFATSAVSGIPYANGLFHGHAQQVWDQSVAILVVGLFSFGMTFAILKALDLLVGIRVSEEEEELGLDITQHGERAYTADEGGVAVLPSPILPAPPVTYIPMARKSEA
ncbi:MAG: ammonium transporter [Chloroflexi bacterium]|nr:ammonium transporter [Chloroflexota bacterium]